MTRYAVVQIENTDDWPPVAMRPWKFDTFWQMPVVLWIRENKRPEMEVLPTEWPMLPWSV